MGCDGGTIPKRHELVKGPKKVEKVDKNAELVARWHYCALSQEKLRKPIVACELGRLYNKDAVIEHLLDKSPDKAVVESAAHIKSIKNVIELNLSDNPAWKGDKGNAKGDTYDDLQVAHFICPVVGLEMNGRHRFCVLRSCGCVFSERALREIKTDVCHKCGRGFQEEDVILLNGSKEEVEMLRKRMEDRRLKAKVGKKSKKCKASECISQPDAAEDSPGPSEAKSNKVFPAIEKIQFVSSSKSEAEGGTSALGMSSSTVLKRPLPNGEEKSEAYKSIFTSHSSAKRTKDQSSNWVTHTAYYF
ncbi:replication termination factor 2 [Rhinatrema bivittatum]|uniref:replication termination factor 2 n=1 Tax=Rhinatrema bivittatum TaxID=194408 RepID=UPI001128A42B|nr:replication termination factor 2 [Rhinatrema bivittatum]